MKDGTYPLRFRMAYTLQTMSGPVEITFGDSLADSVTVGATTVGSPGVKSGVKSFAPTTTIPGSSGRFTTGTSGSVVSSQAPAAPGYFTRINGNVVTTTVSRNFLPVTGLLWTVFLPVEYLFFPVTRVKQRVFLGFAICPLLHGSIANRYRWCRTAGTGRKRCGWGSEYGKWNVSIFSGQWINNPPR
jgi:hypothetical protein